MEKPTLTKEEICRKILGQVKWKTMHELPPGAYVYAGDLLSEVANPKDVVAMVTVLSKFGWFVEAGLVDEPPWSDNLPWAELEAAAPWENRKPKKKRKPSKEQMELI